MAKKEGPRTKQSPKAAAKHFKSQKQNGARPKSKVVPASAVVTIGQNEDEWEDESGDDDDNEEQEQQQQQQPKAKKQKTNGTAKADKKKTKKQEPAPAEPSDDDSDEDSADEEDQEMGGIDFEALNESSSDEDDDNDDGEDNEDDNQEEIDVDDLTDLDEEDEEVIAVATRVRQTINNKQGLLTALQRISLNTDPRKGPFSLHRTLVSSAAPTAEVVPDVNDDLQRELALILQCQEQALQGRTLLLKEGVPFTRPTDYFAETVRKDETMKMVKAKLVEKEVAKKEAAEAKRQRDLKKFGKATQVEKLQERAREKREALDKINLLKRKRKENGGAGLGATEVDDLFDVAVDNELTGNDRSKKRSAGDSGRPNAKRQKKDAKFGFGGKKKFSKSGDAVSSGDLSGFSASRKGPGGPGGGAKRPGGGAKGKTASRPGKARRKAAGMRR